MLALVFSAGCSSSPDRPVDPARHAAPVRVACVGDSITQGNGAESYPAQLGALLGPRWEVRNFGRSGATLLAAGDTPYRQQAEFSAALAFQPDVVIVMLGTNDSKPWNWRHRDRFASDYAALLREFAALPSRPRIWICRPMPAFPPSGWEISPDVIEREIGPLVADLAQSERTGLIDQFATLQGRPDLAPDHVHPNVGGARLLARAAYRALTGRPAP